MKRPDDLKYTGIEAIFRAQRRASEERFFQIDQAGLVKWSREERARLWQAVALHSFLDPDDLDGSNRREMLLRQLGDEPMTLGAPGQHSGRREEAAEKGG